MSLRTRVSLFTGSSLAVAGLSAAASLGAALVPTGVAAQACSPAVDPGAGADIVTCTAGTYPTGITLSSAGDLDVTMVANGATVISTMTANGVNLTGNGADSVSWDSTIGRVTGGAGTVGAVLDVETVTGDISITTSTVNSSAAGATHAIYARSTGGGDIAITRNSSVSANVAGATAAIEADTNGGDISITAAGAGFTTGRLRGVLAQTSGAGAINITVIGQVTAHATDGIAAIDTIAGSGATTIVLDSGDNAGVLNGGAGAAIRSVSAGSVTVQQAADAFTTVIGSVDFSGVAGGVTWNPGRGGWEASGSSVFSGVADTVGLNGGTLASGGMIDLGGGGDTLNAIGSFTATNGTVAFGAGADQFNVSAQFTADGTQIDFGADADTLTVTGLLRANGSTLDFGAGTDTFAQEGSLYVNGVGLISNLEAFDNSGSIFLGGAGPGATLGATDSLADDVMLVTSGTFTGSDDSRIVVDALLGNHAAQIGCATPTVADCVNFTGAATAGSTMVTVQDISFNINGGTFGAPVTIIEGSTAAEHFTLASDSSYYRQTPDGGVIRKPVVVYRLTYDEANQRHLLIGTPADEPFQVGTFAAAAQETWRATSGSWLTRQADMRATPGGLEGSRGVWGRIGAQSGEREATATFAQGGLTFDYDLSQKQRIAHLVFGADLVGGAGWVVGGMVGFARSDVEFDATPTEAATSGFTGGLYASYVAGPLFIDGLFNANILHVKADAPQMGLGNDVPMTFDLKSLGGQLEAGWRIPLGELFVEPLAGVSYVVTRIEDTEVPGGSGLFDFEESESLRIGGGARIGLDGELMGMAASYSLTGRYWNEGEGAGSATITTASGSSAALADDFSGGFSEVNASLNLYGGEGGVSGFVNLGGKFGDDYKAVDGSAGVRVRW